MESSYEDRGFWGRGTITAAVILLLVLIAGGALVIVHITSGGNSPNQAAVPRPHGTGSTGPSTSTRVSSNGCSVAAGSQAVPDATPQGISWNLYETIALPFSKAAGPEIVNGDIAKCYAHSPLGALIAATQLSARLVAAPSVDVAQQQVLPGAGQQAFIAQDSQAIKSQQGDSQPGSFAQFAGFKFVDYSPDTASVELVSQGSNGSYVATTETVAWSDGDWKLVLQPSGSTSPTQLPVTSLVGYSQWAGV